MGFLMENIVLALLLIIISIFDVKCRVIPNFLNFLILCFLVLRMGNDFNFLYSLAGAIWAFALACGYAFLCQKIDVLGGADIKLLIALGVAIGPLSVSVVFIASILVSISYLSLTGPRSVPMAPVISFFAAFFLF